MYRAKLSGIPKDPEFPASLRELGFIITKDGLVRSLADPQKGFRFRISKDDRTNYKHEEAVLKCVREEIIDRMAKLGLQQLHLPGFHNAVPKGPHTTILITPVKTLKLRKRIVVIVNESKNDLAELSRVHLLRDKGIKDGSLVGFVTEMIARSSVDKSDTWPQVGSSPEQPGPGPSKRAPPNQTYCLWRDLFHDFYMSEEDSPDSRAAAAMKSAFTSANAEVAKHMAKKLEMAQSRGAPGIVITNPGQYLYSHDLNQIMTETSWNCRDKPSKAHKRHQVDERFNVVPGHVTPEDHVRSVFRTVLSNKDMVSHKADIFVIGIGSGADTTLRFLNAEWSRYMDRVKGIALISPSMDMSCIEDPELLRFLRKRSRSWVLSSRAANEFITAPFLDFPKSRVKSLDEPTDPLDRSTKTSKGIFDWLELVQDAEGDHHGKKPRPVSGITLGLANQKQGCDEAEKSSWETVKSDEPGQTKKGGTRTSAPIDPISKKPENRNNKKSKPIEMAPREPWKGDIAKSAPIDVPQAGRAPLRRHVGTESSSESPDPMSPVDERTIFPAPVGSFPPKEELKAPQKTEQPKKPTLAKVSLHQPPSAHLGKAGGSILPDKSNERDGAGPVHAGKGKERADAGPPDSPPASLLCEANPHGSSDERPPSLVYSADVSSLDSPVKVAESTKLTTEGPTRVEHFSGAVTATPPSPKQAARTEFLYTRKDGVTCPTFSGGENHFTEFMFPHIYGHVLDFFAEIAHGGSEYCNPEEFENIARRREVENNEKEEQKRLDEMKTNWKFEEGQDRAKREASGSPESSTDTTGEEENDVPKQSDQVVESEWEKQKLPEEGEKVPFAGALVGRNLLERAGLSEAAGVGEKGEKKGEGIIKESSKADEERGAEAEEVRKDSKGEI